MKRAYPLKIDIHTHILPKKIPNFKNQFGYGGFLEIRNCGPDCSADLYNDSGEFFRKVNGNCISPEARIDDCEKSGVQVQVLSTLPAMFSYSAKAEDGLTVAQYFNDHIASVVQRYPKKFVGLGTLPLQDPILALREVERGVNELGLAGFQIGSHIGSVNLSDPTLFDFYELCEKLNVSLFVHPWDMMGKDRMAKYWLPWLVGMPAESSLAICSMIFGGVFRKFPKLRVAFAHGGGSFPFTIGRIQQGFDMRPDLCAMDNAISPRDYLGHFYVDSLVHDKKALRYLIDLFGANRICLGTDYPFPLGETIPGEIIEQLELEKSEKDLILSGAALEWLNLNKDKFI